MSTPFIGQIQIFACNFAVRGWAFCNGQLLPIAQNTALFSLFGTIYGGDGRTTFGLPNLQGRTAMHQGQGPGLTNRFIGQVGGAESVVLTAQQLGAHGHGFQGVDNDRNSTNPANNVLATTSEDYYADAPAESTQKMADQTLDETGGNPAQAHPNEQPFQALNYLVALEGVYPSRS